MSRYEEIANFSMGVATELQRRSRNDGNYAPVLGEARLDAMSAGYLQEYLTQYDPNIIRQEFPEYKFASPLIIPMDQREYVGVKRIQKLRTTRTGKWRRSSEASNSMSPINIGMDDVEYGVESFKAHVEFTVEELDAIDFARTHRNFGAIVDTVSEKIKAVDESYQELMNRVMAFGVPRAGVYGLFTHPGVIKVRAPLKMGLSAATPDQNIAILTEMLRQVSTNSGQRSFVNMCLLPKNLLIDLGQQERSPGGSNASTLDVFRKSPEGRRINFVTAPEMDYAGAGDTTAIHMYRLDKDRIQGCVPKRMRQISDARYVNDAWRIDFHCSISGVHISRPYDHFVFEDIYDLN